MPVSCIRTPTGLSYQIVTYYINITINLFVTENVCVHM